MKIKLLVLLCACLFLAQIFKIIEVRKLKTNNNYTYVNVKEFGARGDGKADDTIAIQKAINHAKKKGELVFPKGNYLVSNINFKSNIHYVGYNAKISARNSSVPVSMSRTSNVTIEGIIFDANHTADHGLYI